VLNELNAIEYSDPVDPIFVREFQLSTLRRPVPTDYFEMVVAESLKLPAAVWRAAVRDIVDSEAPISQGVIHAPTLLLWGEYDDVCPREDQERLAADIPAEVIVYEGHHHAAHWEDPPARGGRRRVVQPSRTAPSSIRRGPLTCTVPRTTTSRPKVTSPSTASRSQPTSDGAPSGKCASKSRSSLK
jgi:hypothetical protein